MEYLSRDGRWKEDHVDKDIRDEMKAMAYLRDEDVSAVCSIAAVKLVFEWRERLSHRRWRWYKVKKHPFSHILCPFMFPHISHPPQVSCSPMSHISPCLMSLYDTSPHVPLMSHVPSCSMSFVLSCTLCSMSLHVLCPPMSHVSSCSMFLHVLCPPMSHVSSCPMSPHVPCPLMSHVLSCPISPHVLCPPMSHVPSCLISPHVLCPPMSHVPPCPMSPHVSCHPMSHVPPCPMSLHVQCLCPMSPKPQSFSIYGEMSLVLTIYS